MAQLIFGRFFWIWILGFLATASYFCALSVNQVVRLSITKFEFSEGANIGLGDDGLSTVDKANKVLQSVNLLDPNNALVVPPPPRVPSSDTQKKKVEKKKPQKDEFGCPVIQPNQKIPETKLRRIRLKGTSFAKEDPSESMAAVYVRVKERIPPKRPADYSKPPRYRMVWRVEFYRMGEIMMPDDPGRKAKLCAVKPKEIVFLRRNKLERLPLNSKKRLKQLYYGSIGAAPPKTNVKGPGQVKVRKGDKFSVSRATVNGWLANPMQHAMSARIMPFYENGKPGGLRLVWVRKKSLYAQLGLRSGDVVQQINGKTLSVNTALGLYSQLPYAKAIRVNIIRKGVRRTLLYNVK